MCVCVGGGGGGGGGLQVSENNSRIISVHSPQFKHVL